MDRLIDGRHIENYWCIERYDLANELPNAYSKNLQEDILEPKTQKTANNTIYKFFPKNNTYVLVLIICHNI